MLFTNRIVTIRERGRSDSVTLDCVRSSKVLIRRGTQANEILLERFGADMRQYDCKSMLQHLYSYLFDNYLLLGDYHKIRKLRHLYVTTYAEFIPYTRKTRILTVVSSLHLGVTYRCLLQSFLWVKYKIFKYKIK